MVLTKERFLYHFLLLLKPCKEWVFFYFTFAHYLLHFSIFCINSSMSDSITKGNKTESNSPGFSCHSISMKNKRLCRFSSSNHRVAKERSQNRDLKPLSAITCENARCAIPVESSRCCAYCMQHCCDHVPDHRAVSSSFTLGRNRPECAHYMCTALKAPQCPSFCQDHCCKARHDQWRNRIARSAIGHQRKIRWCGICCQKNFSSDIS